MTRQVISFTLAFLLTTLVVSSTAFGWAGNTHSYLTQKTFDDPVVAPLLVGIDPLIISQVRGYVGEPPKPGPHNGQWTNVVGRCYPDSTDPSEQGGYDWETMSMVERLAFMAHNTQDIAVPLGHSPANKWYVNKYNEAVLEAQVALWPKDDLPSVVGTTTFTNSYTNHTFNFTGTYDQVVATFYTAMFDNVAWFSDSRNWMGRHSTSERRTASWNALQLALMVERVVLVDYLLSEKDPVVVSNVYTPVANDWIHFDQSGSYDPDAITWNSDGTYSQRYGIQDDGIQLYVWDFDMDGVWDWGSHSPYVSLRPTDLLYQFGCPNNQPFNYLVAAIDNEGKLGHAYGGMILSYNPGYVPEPTTISLLLMGAMGLLLHRRRRS